MSEFPTSWTIVFDEAEDGTMWLVRNHRNGQRTWLRPANQDWKTFIEHMTQ